MACGGTIASNIQAYYEREQYGIKDIEELIEEGLVPSFVSNMGVDFLEFVESLYDEDGNYTDEGLSQTGYALLKKYLPKYAPSYKLD